MFKIIFTEDSEKDLYALDGSVFKQVINKLVKIEKNPYSGKLLGNKKGINLTGFYKAYVCKKKIRIIYTIYESEKIIEIIAIGKRDKEEVYNKAIKSII